MTRELSALFVLVMSSFLSVNAVAEPLLAKITIEPDAVLTTDRLVVIVHGSYTCGPLSPSAPAWSNFGRVYGTVSQASGRTVIQEKFSVLPVLCDGMPQTFQANVLASLLPWHGGFGRANANMLVQRCTTTSNCETATSSADIQIKIKGGGQ